jgi:hypothetical protein
MTMTTTMTGGTNADADARSSSSSCRSSSSVTARGGEYRRPRTSAAPALAALAGSKGPVTAAATIAAASSPPQASRRGPWRGGTSPPPPPLPPHGIDSSGGAARQGVLPPGTARGRSAATKGECQITLKSRADIFFNLIPPRVSAPQLSPLSLTLSLRTRSCLPPPILHFALPRPSSFFNDAFLRPRDGAAASCVPLPTTIPPTSARTTTRI